MKNREVIPQINHKLTKRPDRFYTETEISDCVLAESLLDVDTIIRLSSREMIRKIVSIDHKIINVYYYRKEDHGSLVIGAESIPYEDYKRQMGETS